MQGEDRRRVQLAVRTGGVVFVVAWLFSQRLQGIVPYWLPFFVLALTEIEFVARAWWERRTGVQPETPLTARERRLPGGDDADLGWVEVQDEDGEPMLVPAAARAPATRRPWLLVAGVAAAIALFLAAVGVDRRDAWSSLSAPDQRRAEARFSREATTIAGTPVRIECDDDYVFTGVGSDAAGVAFPRRALAYLQPSICRSLHRIAFEASLGSRSDAAWAITVLAHEAVHLQGVRAESVTECYALQEGTALGRRLGLDTGVARELMRTQLERNLADRSIGRSSYRLPAGCRNGGDLDLRPDDPHFP